MTATTAHPSRTAPAPPTARAAGCTSWSPSSSTSPTAATTPAGRSPATPAWTTGKLVIYRLGDAHRLRLTLATVRQTVTGPRHRLAHTPFLTARHVWLHTDPRLDLDVDGEIRGRTPAQITLEANALRVIGPGARLLVGFFGSSSGDRQPPAALARSSAYARASIASSMARRALSRAHPA